MIIIPAYHRARSIAGHAFRVVAKSIVDARAKRAKKAALHDLLFAPEHRLRDLGIQREEVIGAIEKVTGRRVTLRFIGERPTADLFHVLAVWRFPR